MISQDAEIVAISQSVWANLLSLIGYSWRFDIRPKDPNQITIVHANGKVLEVYSPEIFRLPKMEVVDDPQALAKALFEKYAGVRFVQVLERSSILNFVSTIQRLDWQMVDYDNFILAIHKLALQDPMGLCRYPERQMGWKGIPYRAIKEYFTALPDPSALVLGLFWNSMPWLTVIALKKEKKIRLITSQVYFQKFGINADYLPSGLEDYDALIQLVESRIAAVSVSLVADRQTFMQIVESENKRDSLVRMIKDNLVRSTGIVTER